MRADPGMTQPRSGVRPVPPEKMFSKLDARVPVVLFALALLALIWLLVPAKLRQERAQQVDGAVRDMSNLARTFREHASRTVGAVDQLLLQVKREYEQGGQAPDLKALFGASLVGGKIFHIITVTDRAGNMVFAFPDAPHTNLADREYFKAHAANDSDRLYVGRALTERASGKLGIQVSRRINDRDGAFGGVVVAAVDPGYFTDFYGQVDLGRDGLVMLLGRDGYVRAQRVGGDAGAGQDARASDLRAALGGAAHGNFVSAGYADGVRRLVSFSALADYPLVVLVGTSEAGTLAGYERRRSDYLLGAGGVSVLVLMSAGWLCLLLGRERRAHQRLAESEARFRGLNELSTDGYWEQDEQFRFTLVSDRVRGRHDRTREEYLGKRRWEIPGLEPVGGDWSELRALQAAQRPFRDRVIKRVDAQGNASYASVDGEPMFDASGRFRGYRGVARDVTQQARLGQRLAMEHAVTRLLSSPGPLGQVLPQVLQTICETLDWQWAARWAIDPATGELRCAESWCAESIAASAFVHASRTQSFALRPDGQVVRALQTGESFWRISVEDDAGFRRRPLALDAGLRASFAVPILGRSGPIGAIEFFARAIQPDDLLLHPLRSIGTQIGGFIEREQAAAALRDSEERLRTVTDNVPALIGYVDAEQRYRFVNRAFEDWFGRPAADYPGRTVREVVGDKFYERVLRRNIERVLSGETVAGERRTQVPGRERYARFIWLPHRDAAGAVAGYYVLAYDITELKLKEAEIVRLNAELEQRVRQRTSELETVNQELEAFSYSVAHDLRAPLRAIDGFGKLLLDHCEQQLDADGHDYLDRIRAATQKMASLIEDLLNLAHTGRSELARESVDLSRIAGEVMAELRKGEPQRQVDWSCQPGLHVEGDPRLLRVVLENLLSNAWKYSARRERARIDFAAQPVEPGATAYVVGDDGAGFDMRYADRLFGVFQRLHLQKEYPGNGIGLVTVKRIVQRHSGRVWAEAEVGRGARFYFTLWSERGTPPG